MWLEGMDRLHGIGLTRSISMKKIHAAVIADEFTKSCLESVWHICNLDAEDSLKQLESFKPDILFVESAWQGANNSWQKKITGQPQLLEKLTIHCKKNKIPTLFWNKEDPAHFHHFSRRAEITKFFDIVLTTEVNCIPEYKTILGHDRVYFLTFFSDMRRFKIGSGKRAPGYCFAGSWYKSYPERNSAFYHIYSLIKNEGKNLDIFDRNYLNPDIDLEFPNELKPHVKGMLEFKDIDKAYSGYEVGITLNSVINGQSMFARRAAEMLSCGTAVVSNYTRAISSIFNGYITTVSLNDRSICHVVKAPSDYNKFIENTLSNDYFCQRIYSILDKTFPDQSFGKLISSSSKLNSRVTMIEKLSDKFTHRDFICWGALSKQNLFIKQSFETTSDSVTIESKNDNLIISSSLAKGKHAYINITKEFSTEEFQEFIDLIFIADNDNIELDVWQLDVSGNKVQRDLFACNHPCMFRINYRCNKLKIGFRIIGPGNSEIQVLRQGKLKRVPHTIIPIHRKLLTIQSRSALVNKVIERLSLSRSNLVEVFINTGADTDFEYTSKNGVDIIIGGNRTLAAILKGRITAKSLGYDFDNVPEPFS